MVSINILLRGKNGTNRYKDIFKSKILDQVRSLGFG